MESVGSRKEVANRFVDDAGAYPSRRRPTRIGKTASRDANPHSIFGGIIIHKEIRNGSIACSDGDGGRVGGTGGKGDVGLASARNSGSH